jgi:hypothetical protein
MVAPEVDHRIDRVEEQGDPDQYEGPQLGGAEGFAVNKDSQ